MKRSKPFFVPLDAAAFALGISRDQLIQHAQAENFRLAGNAAEIALDDVLIIDRRRSDDVDRIRLLTVADFADKMSISPRQIWRLIRHTTIRAVKIGGLTRIPSSELIRLVK